MSPLFEFLEKKMGPHWMRVLISIKIFILCVVIAHVQGWITIGEKNVVAVEEVKKEEAKQEELKKEEPKKEELKAEEAKEEIKEEEKTEQIAKTEEPQKQEESKPDPEQKIEKVQESPKRESFLDKLLTLPALNTDKAEKDEIGKYISMAERKKEQVEERVKFLQEREEKLIQIEKTIDDKLHKLEEERNLIAQTLQQEKELKKQRVDQLKVLYEKMEPKKAAPVFEKLDRDLVVELFKIMSQKQVRLILEGMPADKSVQLTEYYGRVRSMREYDMLREVNQSLLTEFAECKGAKNMPEANAEEVSESAH